MCFQLNSLLFSISNLRQNVESVHDCPFQNPFCCSFINASENRNKNTVRNIWIVNIGTILLIEFMYLTSVNEIFSPIRYTGV